MPFIVAFLMIEPYVSEQLPENILGSEPQYSEKYKEYQRQAEEVQKTECHKSFHEKKDRILSQFTEPPFKGMNKDVYAELVQQLEVENPDCAQDKVEMEEFDFSEINDEITKLERYRLMKALIGRITTALIFLLIFLAVRGPIYRKLGISGQDHSSK